MNETYSLYNLKKKNMGSWWNSTHNINHRNEVKFYSLKTRILNINLP